MATETQLMGKSTTLRISRFMDWIRSACKVTVIICLLKKQQSPFKLSLQ